MAFTTRTAMTTKRSIKWGLVAAATAFVAAAAMPGCELLVDFDRTKIPDAGEVDGTTPGDDGTSPEATPAGEAGEAGSGDAASDAPDAPVEGSADAPSEAAAEAGTADTGLDAPVDTGAGIDAATDSGDDGG
jgi:hypothetical protein